MTRSMSYCTRLSHHRLLRLPCLQAPPKLVVRMTTSLTRPTSQTTSQTPTTPETHIITERKTENALPSSILTMASSTSVGEEE